MDRTHIVALAKNILRFTSTLATHINIPDVNPCSLCEKDIYSLASNPQYKEFTLASCGHIFHQKCFEKYLVNGEARCGPFRTCPNKDCNRDIETFLSPDLFKEKGSQDKPSTTDENTTSMPVDSENATPVDEDSNVTVMKELGLFGGEGQSSSKTTGITKETFEQATSPIEVVSTTPGNSVNLDDSISKDTSSQIQRPICEQCSEEISLEFTKPTLFLPCKHVVHYDCIKNSHKMCPTCPSSETMSEVSTLIEQDPSDAQKKRTRESSASTEKSSSKKAKKTGGKKVSSMLKKLIEELLTDVISDVAGENLEEEASENETSNFLQLYDKIDSAESKNEDASQGLIYSYFDFGEAVFKRYKELKLEHGKDGSQALVKSEVRKAIPEAKCSDEALRKRMERSEKAYKLFNSIGKEKIARIRSIPPSYVLNLTKDEKDYVLAEILKQKM